ncbi:hypothetical protein HZS_2444 [Henneguya salminicola]|nr:hypothetical protein HZS_2444 [Henneguya salminicola]
MLKSNIFYKFLLFICSIFANEHDHKYSQANHVIVWYQNFYPKNDLFESYSLSRFPYCQGPYTNLENHYIGFLDAIQGLKLEQSGLEVRFGGKLNLYKFPIILHFYSIKLKHFICLFPCYFIP